MLNKFFSFFICFCLIFEQSLFAQTIDLSHYFVRNPAQTITQSDKFRPLHLRYISYDNQANDFKLLLDKGDAVGNDRDRFLQEETQELMKYFFIGLALPNEKFWVNLRPDSPDNILDPDLEKTDIGRIFLEADLQLKKDTSGMTSPQTKEGREYWDKLYKKAGELFPAAGGSAFGGGNITIPTITRPWIVPNEIIIREAPDNAYIYKATLKVMLEEDYLKSSQLSAVSSQQYTLNDPRLKELNEYSTQLIKESIIPKLTYAVNTSKRYAPLRQVYYSLILAQWFKQKYGSSGSTRAPVNSYIDLIDSGNLSNLTSIQPYDKQVYFRQYQKSFHNAEYNFKSVFYAPSGQAIIRNYVSGGIVIDDDIVHVVHVSITSGKKVLVPNCTFEATSRGDPENFTLNIKAQDNFYSASHILSPSDYFEKNPLFKEDRINSLYFRILVESSAEEIGGKAYVYGSFFYLVDENGYVPLDMIMDIDMQTSFFGQQSHEDEFIKRLNKKLTERTDALYISAEVRNNLHSYLLVCSKPYKFPYNKPERKIIVLHNYSILNVGLFANSLFAMLPSIDRVNRYLLYERFIGELAIFKAIYQEIYNSRRYPERVVSPTLKGRMHERKEKLQLLFPPVFLTQRELIEKIISERVNDINMPWVNSQAVSSALIDEKNGLAGLPLQSASKKGGIAFNALPIRTESVASSVLGALPGERAFKGDLDAEWVKIQAVFNAGVRPSIQRLSEYAAAAAASPLAEDKIDQVRVMLADILRRDEESERLAPAEESCKQLLRALEAG